MRKKYIVRLTTDERNHLEALVKQGKAAAYKIKHANILLNVDRDGPNLADVEVAKLLSCNINTVGNVRQRFVEAGLEKALERKHRDRPAIEKILDGEKEARLIALSCSCPPKGQARWTLQLLADKLVELKIAESISYKTVGRVLKKRIKASPEEVLDHST